VPVPLQVTKYVEREILNHRCLVHPHIVQFREVRPALHPFRLGRPGTKCTHAGTDYVCLLRPAAALDALTHHKLLTTRRMHACCAARRPTRRCS
jgi:hypothetical protein